MVEIIKSVVTDHVHGEKTKILYLNVEIKSKL